MTLKFKPDNHQYTSDDGTRWTSVTTIISAYKEPFDSQSIAEKSSKNKKSKWYGIDPKEIQAIWKAEADRSTTLGTYYHNQREKDLLDCDTLTRYGCELPIIPSLEDSEGCKIAPEQKLTDGIYPEHFIYLASAGWCGQADLIEIVNGVVNVSDFKTSKKIDRESYKNWEGISKKMLLPLQHLDDCSFNHYALQLSIYMYMILRHNPNLKPGKLLIHHVKFEEAEEKDRYGFPIILLNNGEPIVKEIEYIELPYLKSEVQTLLKQKIW
jgi:hypothetical protein